jgi:hypothetical protein
MGNSPNIDLSQAGKTPRQTAANNVPESGERPDQGKAPTMNPWNNSNKDAADTRPMEAPDTLGAKCAHPILAQPPEQPLGCPATVAAGSTAVLK